MNRILVTGCGGFVGGSIGRLAARKGHQVLGIDRLGQPSAGWPGQYIRADLYSQDLSSIIQTFNPDVLLHAAGTASVAASLNSPLSDLQGSLWTWANTLDAVRRSGCRPLLLFPSSAAVYGNPVQFPVREDAPIAPISPYGFHKAACELIGREYSECYGFDVIVCRFFSLFGHAQRRLLVWELYEQFAGPHSTVWIQGNGKESRDYLHIDDAGEALLNLMDNQPNTRRRGQYLIVNVANGKETSVLELAEELRSLIAPEKDIQCKGLVRAGDPQRWCGEVSVLRSFAPSWEPASLSHALAKCVAEWNKDTSK